MSEKISLDSSENAYFCQPSDYISKAFFLFKSYKGG